jgi:hypothetical protein
MNHYNQEKDGDVNGNDTKRLWEKIEVGAASDCWPFSGRKTKQGYGQFWANGRLQYAHRAALIASTGMEPEGKFALHSCDNPPCCNPKHLRWGTHSENLRDAHARNPERRKISHRVGAVTGRRNGSTRRTLNPSQVEYARRLMEAGYSQYQCAEWYDVHRSTMYRISRLEGHGLGEAA